MGASGRVGASEGDGAAGVGRLVWVGAGEAVRCGPLGGELRGRIRRPSKRGERADDDSDCRSGFLILPKECVAGGGGHVPAEPHALVMWHRVNSC